MSNWSLHFTKVELAKRLFKIPAGHVFHVSRSDHFNYVFIDTEHIAFSTDGFDQ